MDAKAFDTEEASKIAIEREKLPLGAFCINPKLAFEESLSVYRKNKEPLYKRSQDIERLFELW